MLAVTSLTHNFVVVCEQFRLKVLLDQLRKVEFADLVVDRENQIEYFLYLAFFSSALGTFDDLIQSLNQQFL